MKKLFCQEESIENKISWFHLLFFLLALPFDRFYSTIILVSLLVHVIFHLRRSAFTRVGREVWALQSVFYVSVLSACYAVSFSGAMNVITKQFAIFLFPLLFVLMPFDREKYRSGLLKAFSLVCSLTVVYLFIDAYKVIRYDHLPLKTVFSASFVHHNFSLPIGLHATYFSMFLALSFVFLLEELIRGNSSNRLLDIICLLVLTAGLIQLSSKSVFIALFIIINVVVPWFLLKRTAATRFLFLSLGISAVVIVSVLSVQVFRERLFTDFKNDIFKTSESEQQAWRIYRWEAAMDLIRQAPVLGHGTGSEIALLKQLYYERKMYAAYLGSLNVHNQYLSFMINSGLIGLLVYLGTLGWGFWKALNDRNLLLASFLALVTIVSFSEDMLDVNKGIFFYAFFFSFLLNGKIKDERIT